MNYVSTRGGMPPRPFTEILLGGLAPDGGLVVPQRIPQIDAATLARWRGLPYADLAFEILSALRRRHRPREALDALIARTYTAEVFGSADITPVCACSTTAAPTPVRSALSARPVQRADARVQGPRDAVARCALFEHVLTREDRWLNILGATSGDTGSAAEYAMRGKRNVRVFMLSAARADERVPAGADVQPARPEHLQHRDRRRLRRLPGPGQGGQGDLAFKDRRGIGTVNSINWARVVAQVVYYFKGYFAATSGNDQQVSFAVPTGNFGNVLAGHIARRMGLPIAKLVVATNENDVLDEFFRTGRYRVRATAETHETSSPSMDISKASNFERFVYDLLDRDAARVASLWQQVERHGEFDLGGTREFHR